MPDRRAPRRDPIRSAGQRAAIVATLVLNTFVVWNWAGLWLDPPVWTLIVAMACATAPVLASLIPHRLAGIVTLATGVLGGFLILATATDSSMVRLLMFRRAAWRAIASRIDDGVNGAATIAIPLPDDPGSHAVSATLVVLIAMTVFLIAAIGMVTRRPLAAIVTAAVALAYRWTLAPPAHPLLIGTVAAALSLAMFASLRKRPDRTLGALARTTTLAGVVLLVAAAMSAGAGSNAWWNWRSWSWNGANGGGSTLSIEQRYGPLDFPDDPVPLLRVTTDSLTPLRAVTLDEFDGAAFTTGVDGNSSPVPVIDGASSLNPSARGVVRNTTIALSDMSSKWVFSGGTPTRITGLGRRALLRYDDDGSLAATPDLSKGTTYSVTTVTPDPGPDRLLRYRGTTSPGVVNLPGVGALVPPIFEEGREPVEDFGPLTPVARLSREIIGDASTQYEAVNRMEGYLRANYRYDTGVAAAPSRDEEIPNFLLRTKTGYCQHFAGSMALMLRMNGIPARVAVGLNVPATNYDARTKEYVVTDRDAHSWVEVYFGEQYGWLAFDPTPTRSANGNSASVSSLSYTGTSAPNAPPKLNRKPVKPVTTKPPPTRTTPTSAPVAPATGGRWWGWIAIGGLVLIALLVPVALKTVRRLRRRRGDERTRVLGAVRELESWLVDLGVPIDPSATPTERVAQTRRALGIDAEHMYGLATDARFSATQLPDGSADQAWQELRRVKRTLPRHTRLGAALTPRSLRRER